MNFAGERKGSPAFCRDLEYPGRSADTQAKESPTIIRNPLEASYEAFALGIVDRREFVQKALTLGLAPAMVAVLSDRAAA